MTKYTLSLFVKRSLTVLVFGKFWVHSPF